MLMPGLILSAAAQELTLHYFDNEYRLGNCINETFESLKNEEKKIELEKSLESLSFTDGANFLLGNVEGIKAEDLKNASFVKTGDITVIHSGVNYVFLEDASKMEENAAALAELAAFLEAELEKAEMLSFRLANGKEIPALHIPGEKKHEFWENTMQLEHSLKIGGKTVSFHTVIKPQGLMSPTKEASEKAKANENHALISIGAGAGLMSEGNPKAFDNMYSFFSEAGTDILLLNPEDLFGFWNSMENASKPANDKNTAGNANASDADTGNANADNDANARLKPVPVFTNADFSGTALEGKVKPYAALTMNGKKILFFSIGKNDEALDIKLDGSGIKFWNPEGNKKLSQIIRKARKDEKADAVILSNAFDESESAAWTDDIKGVDLIINKKRWGKTANLGLAADLEERTERHDSALELERDRHGDGKINLAFKEGRLARISLEMEDSKEIFKPEAREEQKTAILTAFISDENAVMPDAAEMSFGGREPSAFQSPADFHQAAAGMLRRHFNAETAVLEIKADASKAITGYLSADEAREWLGKNEKVQLYMISGKDLKQFTVNQAKTMPFSEYAAGKAGGKQYYAISGLDKRGRLSGYAIRDDEKYLAALPESLAAKCSSAETADGKQEKLVTFIVNEMKQVRKDNADRENWKKEVSALAEDQTEIKGTWRFEIEDLNIYAEKTNIHSPAGYGATSESAFATENRTKVAASGIVKAPYAKGDFFFTPSIKGSYGKTKYETYTGLDSDKLDYDAEFLYAPYELKSLGGALTGPFLTAEYETEFEAENYNRRKKTLREKTGWKLFGGSILKEAYAAFDIERRIYPDPAYTHYAFEAFAKAEYKIPHTNLTLAANAMYRRYLPCHDDDITNLRERLEVNSTLTTKIFKDLSMGFYAKWIYATGARLGGYADSFTFGGLLNYHFLTKWR